MALPSLERIGATREADHLETVLHALEPELPAAVRGSLPSDVGRRDVLFEARDKRGLEDVATDRGRIRRRVVIGDLARLERVADVEDPYARPDPRARDRGGVVGIIDRAVVAAVGQRRDASM